MDEVFVPRVKIENVTIIQGGAKGADAMAKWWAVLNDIPNKEFPAQWEKYGRKLAGIRRNKEMLKSGLHYLIAFPGGTGTENMKSICKKANVPVLDVEFIEEFLNLKVITPSK